MTTTLAPPAARRFASRLDRLAAFPFAELRAKIEARRRAGIDVVSLGSGDPDMPTPAPIVAAAAAALGDPESHRYPSNRGTEGFRTAVAAYMRDRFDVPLDPETEIFPALGGKEALHHLAFACLEAGDVALVPDPAYPVYASAVLLAGAEPHPLPLRQENGFLPDLGAISDDVLHRARLIFVNYPNNPTGAVAPPGFFDELVAFARRHDLVLVHDAAYAEIGFDGYRPPSLLATPGAREVAVEVFSLSKGWNMTGWRVGWIAGNAEILRRYGFMKPNIDSGLFAPIQAAAVAALTVVPDFPREMSRIYQARRDALVAALVGIGLAAEPPSATPFLWFPAPAGHSSRTLADLILAQTGVAVSPGDAFGAGGAGYLRTALMVADDRLREAVRRIETSVVLDVAPGGPGRGT